MIKYFVKKKSIGKPLLLLTIFVTLVAFRVSAVSSFEYDGAKPDSYLNNCHNSGLIDTQICNFGNSEKIDIVLFGDSHAAQYLWPLEKIAKRKNLGLLSLTYSGCPAVSNDLPLPLKSDCLKFNQEAAEEILKARPTFLFMSNLTEGRLSEPNYNFRDDAYSQAIADLAGSFVEQVPNVFFISDSPYPKFDHRFCYELGIFLDSTGLCKIPNLMSTTSKKVLIKMDNRVTLVEPRRILCGIHCPLFQGHNLYRDGSHLSKSGSMKLYEIFSKILSN